MASKPRRVYDPATTPRAGEVYLTHGGERLLVADCFANDYIVVHLGVLPVRALRVSDGELQLALHAATLVEEGFALKDPRVVPAAMVPRSSIARHRAMRSMTTGNQPVITWLLRSPTGMSMTLGSGNLQPWPRPLQLGDVVELLAVDVQDEQLAFLAARGADALAGELAKAQTSKMSLGDLLRRQRGTPP